MVRSLTTYLSSLIIEEIEASGDKHSLRTANIKFFVKGHSKKTEERVDSKFRFFFRKVKNQRIINFLCCSNPRSAQSVFKILEESLLSLTDLELM